MLLDDSNGKLVLVQVIAGAIRHPTITRINVDSVLLCHTASLILNELTGPEMMCHQWVPKGYNWKHKQF